VVSWPENGRDSINAPWEDVLMSSTVLRSAGATWVGESNSGVFFNV